MSRTVVIDYLPASAEHYRDDYAIVVIDVIRATTTATTAVALGREVYPAQTTDDALLLAEKLEHPLLVGEMGGNVPYGFDLTNSPVQVAALSRIPSGFFTAAHRPLVLVSSSGTRLLMNAVGAKAVYISCMRNYSAVAEYLQGRHDHIAILGAGTRGEFRREDQIGCAWLAEKLVAAGYRPESPRTRHLIERWRGADFNIVREGRSADYLRRSGQVHDLEFVLHHIDDLDVVPELVDGCLVPVAGTVAEQEPAWHKEAAGNA